MDVPPVTYSGWKDVVSGKARYQLEFLAAKILLGRLMLKVKNDPSPTMMNTCVQELHNLFAQNADLPNVQNDLKQIFGGVR
jgi:hypothetical protein